MFILLLILFLFQVKHWFVDWVFQSQVMIDHKGIYGDRRGIDHSVQHGIWSAAFLVWFVVAGIVTIPIMLLACFLEVVAHYHIDYVKMRYGATDPSKKPFWMHLGFDQMVHQIWYLLMTALLLYGSGV